eukprot:6457795-Amphidinium_carterae.1
MDSGIKKPQSGTHRTAKGRKNTTKVVSERLKIRESKSVAQAIQPPDLDKGVRVIIHRLVVGKVLNVRGCKDALGGLPFNGRENSRVTHLLGNPKWSPLKLPCSGLHIDVTGSNGPAIQ